MLPFHDKVTLHKTSYIWRAAMIMVIKACIHRILREFFGVHSFQVIQVMRAHTVAIFGSMGWMVMRSGLHLRDNLNMVVGCDDGDALVKDMVRIFGVVGARMEDVLREKESLVSCWMEWKLAAGRCLTLSIACHNTFMPIILSAGTTSQMDFITSDHLVSPYPRLSMNGLSMQPVTNGWFSSRSDIVERQRYTKLDVLNNNSSSEGPCLKGFGVMQWGDDKKTSWSDIDLCWRLGAACENLNCEHRDNNGTWTEHFGSTR
ncbi:hypothetical protein C8J56DRAFT_901486 [Mycena floridula]|nr:hypothetical protein C8J56DRAFT_901486 [Mycena floridula]